MQIEIETGVAIPKKTGFGAKEDGYRATIAKLGPGESLWFAGAKQSNIQVFAQLVKRKNPGRRFTCRLVTKSNVPARAAGDEPVGVRVWRIE